MDETELRAFFCRHCFTLPFLYFLSLSMKNRQKWDYVYSPSQYVWASKSVSYTGKKCWLLEKKCWLFNKHAQKNYLKFLKKCYRYKNPFQYPFKIFKYYNFSGNIINNWKLDIINIIYKPNPTYSLEIEIKDS